MTRDFVRNSIMVNAPNRDLPAIGDLAKGEIFKYVNAATDAAYMKLSNGEVVALTTGEVYTPTYSTRVDPITSITVYR